MSLDEERRTRGRYFEALSGVTLDPDYEKYGQFQDWSISLEGSTGEAGDAPMMDGCQGFGESMFVFYLLEKLNITNNQTNQSIDLCDHNIPNWTYFCLDHPNNVYLAPEVRENLRNLVEINFEHHELLIGEVVNCSEENAEANILTILWNHLVAKYFNEVGIPMEGDEEASNALVSRVYFRREQIIEVFTGRIEGDLDQLFRQSF